MRITFCAENDSMDTQNIKKEPCATKSRSLAVADLTPLMLGHNSAFNSTIEKPKTEPTPSFSMINNNKNSGFTTFKARETKSSRTINNFNSFIKQECDSTELFRSINNNSDGPVLKQEAVS